MTLNQNKENGSMFLDPGQREQRSQEKTMVQQANSSQKDPHSDLDFTTDLLAEPFPVPLALHGDTFTAITFPLFWWVMLQDVLPGFAGSFIEKVRKRTRTKKKKKKKLAWNLSSFENIPEMLNGVSLRSGLLVSYSTFRKPNLPYCYRSAVLSCGFRKK